MNLRNQLTCISWTRPLSCRRLVQVTTGSALLSNNDSYNCSIRLRDLGKRTLESDRVPLSTWQLISMRIDRVLSGALYDSLHPGISPVFRENPEFVSSIKTFLSKCEFLHQVCLRKYRNVIITGEHTSSCFQVEINNSVDRSNRSWRY